MGLFGQNHEEKMELEIIKLQALAIERLTRQKEPLVATALRANYITIDTSGNIIFNTSTTNSMAAQNVTVTPTQNTVPGQIVPLAADLVTVLPISSITPGS